MVLWARRHNAVDGKTHLGEARFVIGHGRALRHIGKRPAAAAERFERPVEKRLVVGLEPDRPVLGQQRAVLIEELRRGQTALELLLLRPRVREIDVQAGNLTRGEHLGQKLGVPVEKADVRYALLHNALHRHDHRVRHLFEREQQHVRLAERLFAGEAALAAAELQTDLAVLRKLLRPAAFMVFRRPDLHRGAALHPGDQVRFFPHSHKVHTPVSFTRHHIIATKKHQSEKPCMERLCLV